MAKCKMCGENTGEYEHFDGGKVCEKCLGAYFTCPKCGILYDNDDFANGDQSGFCKKCTDEYGL